MSGAYRGQRAYLEHLASLLVKVSRMRESPFMKIGYYLSIGLATVLLCSCNTTDHVQQPYAKIPATGSPEGFPLHVAFVVDETQYKETSTSPNRVASGPPDSTMGLPSWQEAFAVMGAAFQNSTAPTPTDLSVSNNYDAIARVRLRYRGEFPGNYTSSIEVRIEGERGEVLFEDIAEVKDYSISGHTVAWGKAAHEIRGKIESSSAIRAHAVSRSGTPRPDAPTEQAPLPETVPTPGAVDFGRYHALLIGNNAYTHLPRLQTAVNDATAVAEILRNDYGFAVTLLTDATRAEIIAALDGLRATLMTQDNLLIYYAGHGVLDTDAARGYWLPVNAKPDTRIHWLSNATITDTLKAMTAKHVMVVADSCYAGTLVRGVSVVGLPTGMEREAYLLRLARKRARTALVSGGLEPVMDSGGGNHSVFAKAFLRALEENRGVLDGQQLFTRIRRPVVLNAPQTPEYADIRFAGHDGGDFLFVRR